MSLNELDEVSILAHIYVETEYLDYEIAIERAKEKLLSDRVGAHKSENSISKEYNDSISLYEDIDNGEIYNIETGETIKDL